MSEQIKVTLDLSPNTWKELSDVVSEYGSRYGSVVSYILENTDIRGVVEDYVASLED